ncbi:hypothetical protein GDO86_018164, partial [Hymenochirus boettgeri]
YFPSVRCFSPPLPSSCQAKTHIVFLKIHKTAGSTVLNILHRYGDENSLTFALPISNDFNYVSYFHSNNVKGFTHYKRKSYDILCHHMRFNLREVKKVMPADSFYFTILRDPATMAESAFFYYRKACITFKNSPNLTAFIYNPSKYHQPNKLFNHYAHNLMWFDLGFNHNAPFTEDLASEGVRSVEKTFNLVLIAEYFDESMILLKEELCWELDDVVTFKLNSRAKPTQLEPEDIKRLRAWNALDWYLYVYFNQTFWDKVERFGRKKMNMEVTRLRKRRQQLAELCLEGMDPVGANQIQEKALKPYQPENLTILGWRVKNTLGPTAKARCVRMVTPELQYLYYLDTWHFHSNSIKLALHKWKEGLG